MGYSLRFNRERKKGTKPQLPTAISDERMEDEAVESACVREIRAIKRWCSRRASFSPGTASAAEDAPRIKWLGALTLYPTAPAAARAVLHSKAEEVPW